MGPPRDDCCREYIHTYIQGVRPDELYSSLPTALAEHFVRGFPDCRLADSPFDPCISGLGSRVHGSTLILATSGICSAVVRATHKGK